MALLVKLMSAEDAPDTDSRKAYELFTDVVNVSFSRGEGGEAGAHARVKGGARRLRRLRRTRQSGDREHLWRRDTGTAQPRRG